MIYEPSQIACDRCKREYSLRLGEDPTLLCDRCAHEVAEVAWKMTPTYHELREQYDRVLRVAAIPTDAENRFREALAAIAHWPEGGAKGDRPDLMREYARAAITATPPSGAALRGEVVAHRWHWAGTHGEWQDGPGDPRVIAEIEAREGYRLEKAYAVPSPAQGWRPIESAPKDEVILLFGAKKSPMVAGMLHSRDGWVIDTPSEWMTMYPPTHWMPLPAPPPPAGESQ